MILKRSLLLRLILFSLLGAIVTVVTLPATYRIPLTYLKLYPYDNTPLDSWAQARARSIVIDTLRKTANGGMFIEQTDALKSLKLTSPQFRYAVVDATTNVLADGSEKELLEVDRLPAGVQVRGFSFHLTQDSDAQGSGSVSSVDSPLGPVRIIFYGAKFSWKDIIFAVFNSARVNVLLNYSPVFITIIAISAFTFYRGLAPLRQVAASVSRIDLKSLNQRVATSNVPSEILPLVDAMNEMLERVDAGVASQQRFAANAAHELRTPIAILRARVDRMENAQTKFELMRDVRRIQTIADQLLVIARDEARGETVQSEVVDLADTAHAVVADYLPISLDLGRGIEFEAHSAPPTTARASKWALECVIRNLVENAVRFEPIGGTVVVRVLPSGTVEVVDHGEGIRQKDREAIFEPFWRKNELTPGAGLGLAIARELISRYRGRIWVDDTPGGGATFKISLLSADAGV